MKNWCEMANNNQPLVLLTDLDSKPCASVLIKEWLGRNSPPINLVLRVAVRDVESWLLADHEGMQQLLGKAKNVHLPLDPDRLPDPKRYLLSLAGKARRDVRDDLVETRGSSAIQGLGYNARLCSFVCTDWSIERASSRSDSLRRTRLRLSELATRLAHKA